VFLVRFCFLTFLRALTCISCSCLFLFDSLLVSFFFFAFCIVFSIDISYLPTAPPEPPRHTIVVPPVLTISPCQTPSRSPSLTPPLHIHAHSSQVVRCYLREMPSFTPVNEIVGFYLRARQEASNSLTDGAGLRPHFSLRTLARALTHSRAMLPIYGLRRSLYEGFCMTFLTSLGARSVATMQSMIQKVRCVSVGK